MLPLHQYSFSGVLAGRRLVIVCLAIALCLLVPATISAAPLQQDEPPADQPCVKCHEVETAAWQQAPHAAAKVDCETCHGVYKEGHPETDMMPLSENSQVCIDCHKDTYDQWKDTKHAQEDVQCINCHVSHSQDTRLSSEWLCGACHADQINSFTHTAHYNVGVTCTSCHASGPTGETADGKEVISHHFAAIDAKACLDCHAATIHEEPVASATESATLQPAAEKDTEAVTTLATKLTAAEKENRTLRTLPILGFGLGLGFGAIAGIVFVLGIYYFNRGAQSK